MTRGEFAQLAVATFGFAYLSPRDVPFKPHYHFKDTEGHWANGPIELAYERGIVQGTSPTTFTPDAHVKREEAATIMWRYLTKHGIQPLPTSATPPNTDTWAANEVSSIMHYHLYGADVTGTDYRSQQTMTRQEVAQLIWSSMQLLARNGDQILYDATPLPRHLVLEGDGSAHIITFSTVNTPYGYADITFDGNAFTMNTPATNSSDFAWEISTVKIANAPTSTTSWISSNAKKYVLTNITELEVCLVNVSINTMYAQILIHKDENGNWVVQPYTLPE